MTPKEKAIELVGKFHSFTYTAVYAHKTSGEYADAKECALIAVDEIRDNLPLISEIQQYWIDVKKEINLL